MSEAESIKDRLRHIDCAVAVPVYNNEGQAGAVLDELVRYAPLVIAVNDGSTDSTLEILRRAEGDGVAVISYEKNRGKGYALQKAFEYALGQGFRYLISIDGDGQHYVRDLIWFAEAACQYPDSLIVGSRSLEAENMPRKNSFANRFSNFWFRLQTGRVLGDTQSGYRLYPIERMRGMRFVSSRYEFEVEVLVRAAWAGIPTVAVPIGVYYPPAGKRVTHFRPGMDFMRISLLNAGLCLGALFYYYPKAVACSAARTLSSVFSGGGGERRKA